MTSPDSWPDAGARRWARLGPPQLSASFIGAVSGFAVVASCVNVLMYGYDTRTALVAAGYGVLLLLATAVLVGHRWARWLLGILLLASAGWAAMLGVPMRILRQGTWSGLAYPILLLALAAGLLYRPPARRAEP